MKKKIKPFKREYPGFESIYDLERDVSEWLEDSGLSDSEFTGTVKVTITYDDSGDE